MTKVQRDIASFVLRFTQELWQDTEGEPQVQWRGYIQHVQSDQETHFSHFAEAVGFVQQRLAELTMESVQGNQAIDREKAMHSSLAFWEEFAANYTNVMLETIAKSRALKKQMDRAFRQAMDGWRGAATPGQREVLEGLQGLQAQVDGLAAKIDRLGQVLKEQ
ncbi:MAG: hypothetical protein JW900_13025 [Anaerolineae bacterium]|nr:hypothetical protein [Anaerolineae bacterium]